MKHSTERILTTHCGSLPRPKDLLDLMKASASGEAVNANTYAARVRSGTRIEETAKLVDEVEASSKEQAQGIEQISKAVAQMDQVARSHGRLQLLRKGYGVVFDVPDEKVERVSTIDKDRALPSVHASPLRLG